MIGKPIPLLSHTAAEVAGRAMYDRFLAQTGVKPPLDRDDAGWADMFWAGWEAARSREASGDVGH